MKHVIRWLFDLPMLVGKFALYAVVFMFIVIPVLALLMPPAIVIAAYRWSHNLDSTWRDAWESAQEKLLD